MKKAISIIMAALFIFSAALLASCGKKGYEGTWKGEKNGFNFEVVISSDNTGEMIVSGAENEKEHFKIEGDVLIMDCSKMGLSVDEYRHKLTLKGNTLTIESPDNLADFDQSFYGWIFPLTLNK